MFRFRLSTLLIFVSAIAIIAAYSTHRHRTATEALTSLSVNGRTYADGRAVHIDIGGNHLGRSTVVLIRHVATRDQKRLEVVPGKTYSGFPPMPNLKSELRIQTHYPPDPRISGVWIDGQKQHVGHDLLVVYVSDLSTAEKLEIPSGSKSDFVADAAKLDPLKFVDRWVEPNRESTTR